MWRRLDRARLLVLGTHRAVDAIVRGHPVRRVAPELQSHGRCVELVLPYLLETEVAAYLARRLGEGVLPDAIAKIIRQRTDGNPLSLGMVVDELVRSGVLREGVAGWEVAERFETVVRGVPESLRNMVEQPLEQLSSTDQALLEGASVAGAEFSAPAVAVSMGDTEEAVEARCDALARRGQFLRAPGVMSWSDGTVTTRYAFMHALFQEILYEQVPVSRRMRWHRQIGARLELAYGSQARERRSAHQEAIAHLRQGLVLLSTQPETPERTQQEMTLQITLDAGDIVKCCGRTEADQAASFSPSPSWLGC